jgi:hypothetical protein
MACSCHEIGTKVGFTHYPERRTFLREQTWGRAVRASYNSQELGTLLIFCGYFSFPVSMAAFALCRCRGFPPLIEGWVTRSDQTLHFTF